MLDLGTSAPGPLAVSADIIATGTAGEVWLAVYENNLEPQVRAGENRGTTLRHDYVVRRLIGPLAPHPKRRLTVRQQILP